jgi:hypothetical protein
VKDRLALWAGLTALFTNLAAINVLTLLGDSGNRGLTALAALITAAAAAGAVWAKQHRDDERAKRGNVDGQAPYDSGHD